MVRNRENPHRRNGRSPLTVVAAASLVAGSIGSYSLLAPGGLNLLDAQAGGRTVVSYSSPGQVAALVAYQRPSQRGVGLLAGGSRPSANRALPVQVLPPGSTSKPITFSLFAGWGGAITWDPNTGEVTVAFGVGRQFSLLQWTAGATVTGKLNGKWSTDGSLTFRAIGQIKFPRTSLASFRPRSRRCSRTALCRMATSGR